MALFVTVQPGVTVDANTVLDASTLNRLGTPTVDVTGTLDGASQVTISPGAVDNSMLANMTGPTVKGKESGTGAPTDIPVGNGLEIATTMGIATSGVTTAMIAANAITNAKIGDATLNLAKLVTQAALTVNGNAAASGGASSPPEAILIGGGLALSGNTGKAASTRSRASNVATIVTTAAHGLSTGDVVNVTGVGGTGYTAYHASITVINTTTFTYSNTGSDELTPQDATGGVVRKISSSAGVPASTLKVGNGSPISLVDCVSLTSTMEFPAVAGPAEEDVTDLSITVTPQSASSKFFLIANLWGNIYESIRTDGLVFFFNRGESHIGGGDAAGNRRSANAVISRPDQAVAPLSASMMMLDEPGTTSSITYKVSVRPPNNSVAWINRGYTDTNASSVSRVSSWFAVFEIA